MFFFYRILVQTGNKYSFDAAVLTEIVQQMQFEF